MFDEVTKREGSRRASRRARYLLGSSVAQVAGLAAFVAISAALRPEVVAESPLVPVTIVRSAAPAAPAPDPSPKTEVASPRPAPRPRRNRNPSPPNPAAMLQPRELPPELKPAEPAPAEPSAPAEDAPDGGTESGGGDPGDEGVVGGGTNAGGRAGGSGMEDDAPVYPTAGFKRPELVRRGCIQDSMRLPADLRGFAFGLIRVKFAVGRDGAPSSFQVLSDLPDPRIGSVIWNAIRSCRWLPGADPQGRSAATWVTMPIRFQAG